MTQWRFSQFSLLWPFAAWCLYLAAHTLISGRGIGFVFGNIYSSLPVFIPYAVFAAILWRLIENKTYRQLVLIAVLTPIMWGFFYVVAYMIQLYVVKHMVERWYVLCIVAFWALVGGYAAEAIPLLLLTIFKDDFRSGEAVQNKGAPLS